MSPHRTMRRAVTSLVLAVSAVVALGTADPARADPRWFLKGFENVNSGKCLTYLWDNNDGTEDPAVQYTCSGDYPDPRYFDTHDAKFELAYAPSPPNEVIFSLRTEGTNMCLEVENFSTANFANVSKHACNGGPHQQWRQVNYGQAHIDGRAPWDPLFVRALDRSVMLVNAWSGKCLEVYQYAMNDFASITQYDCYGGWNQLWWPRAYDY